jgi:hypothetical protein
MQLLKLAALDTEDLEILSAHLQDAVMRVSDIAYVPAQKRFALVLNRFDWEGAEKAKGGSGKKGFERRRSALRFDRVLTSQVQGIRQKKKDTVLNLLAIQFEETDSPEGYVTLQFAGGGAIRLHVECIEAELKDLGPVWRASRKPEHTDEAG